MAKTINKSGLNVEAAVRAREARREFRAEDKEGETEACPGRRIATGLNCSRSAERSRPGLTEAAMKN